MDPVPWVVLHASLSLLFAGALIHKVRDWPRFVAIVEDYEIGPRALARPLACAVAAAEAGAAIALGMGLRVAPVLGLLLIVAYSAAIGVNLARGRSEIDCGCGGPGGQRIGPGLLVRNAMLAIAALAALVPPADRPLGGLDVVTIGFAVVFVAIAWSTAGRMASLPTTVSRERIPT